MKVGVVEDDTIMLEHITAQLESLGCETAGATSVTEALAMVERFQPDALVVDILMPDRDGLNLIMELRPLHERIRIVAITGGGRLGAGVVLKMAEALGAHASLVKPFSGDDLKAALQLA